MDFNHAAVASHRDGREVIAFPDHPTMAGEMADGREEELLSRPKA